MAYYAALAPLVQLLEDIILFDRYPKFVLGKQRILKSLQEKFSFLEELLQDYSSKGDEVADQVEGRIRDVAYRAQNIIESDISIHIESDWRTREVTSSLQHEEDLEKAQQDVDSIVEEVMMMKRSQANESFQREDNSTTEALEQTPTGLNIMVGFDEYMTTIKDQLCRQSDDLQVIPIVGMGGIGKTTLARNTFDDALILHHFYCRAWVVVSQNCKVDRVLASILKSLGIHESCGDKLERIYKYLKGRRYLIVLDDVWGTKVWDDIKHAFPNDSNGSRIMLTTRLLDVAHDVGICFEMPFLDVNVSWNLLREKVFVQASCPPELEDIGKTIACKCRGLPLAIVVIAGILSKVRTPQYWRNVSRNMDSFWERDDEHLSNILSLSFNNLSHPLKACYLYMGIFPEDYEFSISRLAKLWIAEGLLKSVGGLKTLEKVAEECLEDLVKRNLVIITKKRANGKFKHCVIHDVLRDFCRQRAVHERMFHVTDQTGKLSMHQTEDVRRITVESEMIFNNFSGFGLGPNQHVCTILWLCKFCYANNICFLENCIYRLLKVLDASSVLLSLPTNLQMFHLKYLALRLTNYKALPPSIFKLWNLQTLVIYHPEPYYISLPSELWQLHRLRHIMIDRMALQPIPTVGGIPVRILEDLQTLEKISNFIFTYEAIGIIPNLRKLKTRFYGRYPSEICSQYGLHNLVHLHRLEELKITFDIWSTFPYSYSMGNNFVFPRNLKKLSLQGCRLAWSELTVVGSLTCLQVLRLKENAFVGKGWEPIEGEFVQLKFLLMERLNFEWWKADSTHFPRLEHLKIHYCWRLQEIPLTIGEIPTLEIIELRGCLNATSSAEKILEEQQSYGNDGLRVLFRD